MNRRSFLGRLAATSAAIILTPYLGSAPKQDNIPTSKVGGTISGTMSYDTSANRLFVYDGSQWRSAAIA